MRVTIGEIVDRLAEYCNSVDVTVNHGIPFLRARISTSSCYTVCYMYVIQTEEHTYAVADARDDINGNRFFPRGTSEKPFVVEQDVVRSLFGVQSGDGISYKYADVVTGLNANEFMMHLFKRLSYYEIIRFSTKNLTTRVPDMGFTSVRIRRVVEEEFKKYKCHQGTIQDLINIVMVDGNPFSLSNLRSRETSVIVAKLRELGIEISINDSNCITSLKFDKRKGAFS